MITYPHLSTTGRLGNQLWEIASTLGIAASRGAQARFPLWDYQPYFSVPDALFVDPLVGTDAITLVPHLDHRAAPYLQDLSLFADIEPTIRDYFEPSELAAETLSRVWDEEGFGDYPEPLISVHSRRGDNVTHPPGYHPLRTLDYYTRAVEHCGDGVVVCFSDDIHWCRTHLERALDRDVHIFYEGTARPREYVDRQRYIDAPILDWIDLQLMAACDRHVLSNSTYAWWGAFLSQDPQPIYPTNWFGCHVHPYTDASLMFPDTWLQMHDDTEGGI